MHEWTVLDVLTGMDVAGLDTAGRFVGVGVDIVRLDFDRWIQKSHSLDEEWNPSRKNNLCHLSPGLLSRTSVHSLPVDII